MSQNVQATGAGVSCDTGGWLHVSVAFAGTSAEASGPKVQTTPTPVTAAGSGYTCPAITATAPAARTTAPGASVDLPGPSRPVVISPHSSRVTAPRYTVVEFGICPRTARGRAGRHLHAGTVAVTHGTQRLAVIHLRAGLATVRVPTASTG